MCGLPGGGRGPEPGGPDQRQEPAGREMWAGSGGGYRFRGLGQSWSWLSVPRQWGQGHSGRSFPVSLPTGPLLGSGVAGGSEGGPGWQAWGTVTLGPLPSPTSLGCPCFPLDLPLAGSPALIAPQHRRFLLGGQLLFSV